MRVETIISNWNTSRFAELALRSLRHTQTAPDVDLRVTVTDDNSTEDTSALRDAARTLGATFEMSNLTPGRRVPWAPRPARGVIYERGVTDTHADVLRNFVLDHEDCDAYLLVDSDVVFIQDDTVSTMARELLADDGLWAVQARFSLDGAHELEGGSLYDAEEQSQTVGLASYRISTLTEEEVLALRGEQLSRHRAYMAPRCNAACALLRNTATLRLIAREVGFSPAWVWSPVPELGGFYDTLALVTKVMRTHGLRFGLSSAMVIHFMGTSQDQTPEKLDRCDALLAELRG
jgi:hypothetical protein